MSDVRLTVLGSAGSHAGAGRACSGYLLEAGGHRLLLDAGNGSLTNLQRIIDVGDIDHVVISHRHPDHVADLWSLYYARRFHPGGPRPIDVHAARGVHDVVVGALGSDGTLDAVVTFHEVGVGDHLSLGPFEIDLFPGAHPVETLMSRIAVDGRTITYTADTDACAALDAAALDVDLLVCDATWLAADGPHPVGIHLTGTGAGQVAARAGAARLLATHVLPSLDHDRVAAEAAYHFDGPLAVADDLMEIDL